MSHQWPGPVIKILEPRAAMRSESLCCPPSWLRLGFLWVWMVWEKCPCCTLPPRFSRPCYWNSITVTSTVAPSLPGFQGLVTGTASLSLAQTLICKWDSQDTIYWKPLHIKILRHICIWIGTWYAKFYYVRNIETSTRFSHSILLVHICCCTVLVRPSSERVGLLHSLYKKCAKLSSAVITTILYF